MRILLLFIAFSPLFAHSAPHLSRNWVRSTLANQHTGFRYLNKMSPILTETMVIQGNAVDGLKVFNRKTGHLIWSRQYKNGVEGGAVVDGDRLYFGAGDGFLYCLSVSDGREIWKYQLNTESLTKPTVSGSKVYHLTANDTLYAFDKISGQSLWVKTNSTKSNMTIRGQTTPVISEGQLYVGYSDGQFMALNSENGREIWSKRIGDDKRFNDVDATAVISSSCLLVSSFANALYCLNKETGHIQWRHEFGGYNSVFLDNDKIYYPAANGEIHLLDEKSGKLLKKIINVRGLASEIVGLKNYIAYGETTGALVLREKESLKQVHQFFPGKGLFARPTVDTEKNEIYFISNDANLFRLDLKFNDENPFLWSRQ